VGAHLITLSPHVPLGDAERMARSRVERDDVAVLAASVGDQRQVRQLRRLSRRLAGDETLDVYLGDHGDGGLYLTVYARAGRGSRRGLGWLGGYYRGQPDEVLDVSGSIDG
jgi:hypothetical protein